MIDPQTQANKFIKN
jgi:dynein heavy chain